MTSPIVKPRVVPCTSWTTFLNQDYSTATATKSTLADVRVPNNGVPNCPAVVYVHGGAWINGDKADNASWFSPLIREGWAVVSINYRLDNEADWPAMLYDAKCAIRAVRANAGLYRLDPNFVFMFGASAGANIVAQCANTNGVTAFDKGDWLNYKSDVTAVVCDYGPLDLRRWASQDFLANYAVTRLIGANANSNPDKVDAASPLVSAHEGSAPTLLRTGDADTTVRAINSQVYFDKLQSLGVSSKLEIFPRLNHAAAEMYYTDKLKNVSTWLKGELAAA